MMLHSHDCWHRKKRRPAQPADRLTGSKSPEPNYTGEETNMPRLTGKVAIITGAAQGIGVEYAKALAAEGARIAVADVADTASAVAALRAAGGPGIGLKADVTHPEFGASMVGATVEAVGGGEILLNQPAP